MPATYQVKIVDSQESLELLMAEDFAASSLVFGPINNIFVRIIPKQICNEAAIRHVCWLRQVFNIFEFFHALRNATVHTHNFLINQGYERHVVEAIIECLPE